MPAMRGGVYSCMRAWQRFRGLNAADRGLIVEAAAWLFGVRLGLAALPFLVLRRTLLHLSDRFARRAVAPQSAQRVAWAVTSAARHLPLSMTCLIESLAAHAMLRRRGMASELRFGVRRTPPSLAAHAWVEHDGAVVVGRIDDLSEYATLR